MNCGFPYNRRLSAIKKMDTYTSTPVNLKYTAPSERARPMSLPTV